MIEFFLSATLSRIHHVSMGGDSSPSVSSNVESSTMVDGYCGRGGGRGRGHD